MWILSTSFFMTVWQVCDTLLFAPLKGSVSVFSFMSVFSLAVVTH